MSNGRSEGRKKRRTNGKNSNGESRKEIKVKYGKWKEWGNGERKRRIVEYGRT